MLYTQMDKKVETTYSANVLGIWRGTKGKNKNWELLELSKILSRSVLSGKLFYGSQHSPNSWLLLVYI